MASPPAQHASPFGSKHGTRMPAIHRHPRDSLLINVRYAVSQRRANRRDKASIRTVMPASRASCGLRLRIDSMNVWLGSAFQKTFWNPSSRYDNFCAFFSKSEGRGLANS